LDKEVYIKFSKENKIGEDKYNSNFWCW